MLVLPFSLASYHRITAWRRMQAVGPKAARRRWMVNLKTIRREECSVRTALPVASKTEIEISRCRVRKALSSLQSFFIGIHFLCLHFLRSFLLSPRCSSSPSFFPSLPPFTLVSSFTCLQRSLARSLAPRGPSPPPPPPAGSLVRTARLAMRFAFAFSSQGLPPSLPSSLPSFYFLPENAIGQGGGGDADDRSGAATSSVDKRTFLTPDNLK